MFKRYLKIFATILSLIILLSTTTLFFVGCGGGEEEPSPPADTTPVSVSSLGYLEDFGNEVVTNSRLKADKADKKEQNGSYYGVEEVVPRKIFFSHLGIPEGEYEAKLGDTLVGKIEISAYGDAFINSVPQGLTLGEYYTLTCTTDSGKPYAQTIRLVSRTIDDDVEMARALTYYTRYYEMEAGLFDGKIIYNSEKPADTTNPGKYYDGQSFSKRLYVLATDIDVSHNIMVMGVDGYGTNGADAFRNPYTNLWFQRYNYVYDEFDGQGHTVVLNNIIDGGVFGNLGKTAYIHDMYVTAIFTWWNKVSVDTKVLIGMGISDGARIENFALNIDCAVTIGGINVLATVIKEGAILKDIYIHLSNTVVFEPQPNDLDAPYRTGLLGYKSELESVQNVVIVSPYVDSISWLTIEGERYKVGAENDYDEYCVEGLYRFDYVDEAINNGKTVVGSWYIRTDGSVKWKNS